MSTPGEGDVRIAQSVARQIAPGPRDQRDLDVLAVERVAHVESQRHAGAHVGSGERLFDAGLAGTRRRREATEGDGEDHATHGQRLQLCVDRA
jgi:hypothetical protein